VIEARIERFPISCLQWMRTIGAVDARRPTTGFWSHNSTMGAVGLARATDGANA
jgi:hypothetical protein